MRRTSQLPILGSCCSGGAWCSRRRAHAQAKLLEIVVSSVIVFGRLELQLSASNLARVSRLINGIRSKPCLLVGQLPA
jgi:hypothetical protein